MSALIAVALMACLTVVIAAVVVLANRWLAVVEDPRVAAVENMLPHTNCGACGYPGCLAFAQALVRGDVLPGKCSVSSPDDHAKIAAFLGVDVGAEERRVARLACAGGSNVARNRAHYQGLQSCAAAALVAGGGKGCFWGCLGLADCERACTFDAIEMDPHLLPIVDEDRCTGCGDCVRACPKDLFSLHAISHRLWVACSSLAHGEEMLEDCEVGCTGCGRCAMNAPDWITMHNHLPVIDYSKGLLNAGPTERCPTGAIVWLDEQAGPIKGHAARHVIRQGERKEGPS
jgi:Na+-translocating ferredoxin:NAD+ oxidoreductase RNF subunit RnfB